MAGSERARIVLSISALAALWLVVTAIDVDVARASDSGALFRRGIAISHAMAWARIEPGPAHAFAFPPFSDQGNALTRDELRYVLDPKDVYGPNFPSETFRVLKEKEMKRFGEYRTRRLVLEAFNKLADSPRFRDEMPKRTSALEVPHKVTGAGVSRD